MESYELSPCINIRTRHPKRQNDAKFYFYHEAPQTSHTYHFDLLIPIHPSHNPLKNFPPTWGVWLAENTTNVSSSSRRFRWYMTRRVLTYFKLRGQRSICENSGLERKGPYLWPAAIYVLHLFGLPYTLLCSLSDHFGSSLTPPLMCYLFLRRFRVIYWGFLAYYGFRTYRRCTHSSQLIEHYVLVLMQEISSMGKTPLRFYLKWRLQPTQRGVAISKSHHWLYLEETNLLMYWKWGFEPLFELEEVGVWAAFDLECTWIESEPQNLHSW